MCRSRDPLDILCPSETIPKNGQSRSDKKHKNVDQDDKVASWTGPFAQRSRLSDIAPVELSWLWPGRIPLGKLTLLVGDPGLGKSFLMLDIAARLSSGTAWPDSRNESVEPRNVVLLSAEDDLADTIRPRLDATHADCSRIEAITSVVRNKQGVRDCLTLDTDMQMLREAIGETNASLCVIDPISAYLGRRDSHSNADIRGLLHPLADIASELGCAIVAVSHLNKQSGGQAMQRAMGSLAFIAAARMGWLLAKDKEDETRRLLLPIKTNLVQEPHGIAFRIIDGKLDWDDTPVTGVDADSVLQDDREDRPERKAAEEWLLELLATDPMDVREIRRCAEAECIAWRTIERAKKSLCIVSSRSGYGHGGKFVWDLPGRGTH